MRKQNFRTDVHKNKFTDNMRNMGQIYIWKCGGKITWNDKIKTGTVLHIEMLLEKSWRPEQGIIYDCYAKYVTETCILGRRCSRVYNVVTVHCMISIILNIQR